MKLTEYKAHLDSIPFGKRLPTAVYVYRDNGVSYGTALDQLVSTLISQHLIGDEFNVIKFRTTDFKVSFLSYPHFMEAAHPSLLKAVTIDLVTGQRRITDYSGNLNPPILHRKEKFLPENHPNRNEFEILTKAEEIEGLYKHVATIGFKLNWERLLSEKGLVIQGHLITRAKQRNPRALQLEPFIERHKTALTRYELSKPIKSLLEYGKLKPEVSFFDYGCGQGSDVRGLKALGYQADGWDPVYRKDAPKHEADVVNFGYVLNVIEDPVERLEALVDAHKLAQGLLVVSALIRETVETNRAVRYQDGILTQRNTFQKFFDQQELQQYIEDALETTAVPVALGIFYVFRDPVDLHDFLAARSRRQLNWTQISEKLGLGRPRIAWRSLYEAHKELLDAFGNLALELRRLPESVEFNRINEIVQTFGSEKRALRVFVQGSSIKTLDWNEVRMRFGIGLPPKRSWEILYQDNRELLESFWNVMLQLGRLPEPEEFSQLDELRLRIGSPNIARRIFLQKGGTDEVKRAEEHRKRDLLVYVALANLRKRVPFGHLSSSLKSDVRAFFGNYTRALKSGIELLYSAGDVGEIELACEDLKVGWQDEQALYLHQSLLVELPPVLRAYTGCATALYGDVSQADVIKIHKRTGKVTFLVYDNFAENKLPELRQRIKVNLRTRWVQVFDHSLDEQLLYFKERLLPLNHPQRSEMEAFSAKLRRLGLSDKGIAGPTKKGLAELRKQAGVNENLNKVKSPPQE